MRKILDAKQGSRASLDTLKKRYNVLREFLPKVTRETMKGADSPKEG
jgi:hypothetical protein